MTTIFCMILLSVMPQQDPNNVDIQAAYDYLFSSEEKVRFDSLNWPAQVKFWEDFWRRNDPTPQTPNYNDLLQKFRERLEVANANFSPIESFDDGWKTDRGRVYIFFGPPTAIYRSPFGPTEGSKYEIWAYKWFDEQGVQSIVELVFEDAFDSGDFVLKTNVVFPTMFQLNDPKPALMADEETGR